MRISPSQYQRQFLASETARDIKRQLIAMERDSAYVTRSTYDPRDSDGDGTSFVDKHMSFISTHPDSKPAQYMANLRLMTKVSGVKRR